MHALQKVLFFDTAGLFTLLFLPSITSCLSSSSSSKEFQENSQLISIKQHVNKVSTSIHPILSPWQSQNLSGFHNLKWIVLKSEVHIYLRFSRIGFEVLLKLQCIILCRWILIRHLILKFMGLCCGLQWDSWCLLEYLQLDYLGWRNVTKQDSKSSSIFMPFYRYFFFFFFYIFSFQNIIKKSKVSICTVLH